MSGGVVASGCFAVIFPDQPAQFFAADYRPLALGLELLVQHPVADVEATMRMGLVIKIMIWQSAQALVKVGVGSDGG